MNTKIIGLLSETSVHPGAGQSMGTVDLPVAREAATDFPVIFGSSAKGALRDRMSGHEDVSELFGKQEGAGQLIVCDARLVLLPVRALAGAYRWLTCPLILERFGRDLRRAGCDMTFEVPAVKDGEALGPDNKDTTVFLEERQATVSGQVEDEVLEALKGLMEHKEARDRAASQVMVVSDHDFAWFARYALQVNARNELTGKKTSNNLWFEETLPPDTVLSWMIGERPETGALDKVTEWFEGSPYIQMGGNETVGQGWLAMKMYADSELESGN